MNDSFIQTMKPKTKAAFVCFVLAKISCFTIAPLFVVLARLGKIPQSFDWVGLGVYGGLVLTAIFLAGWEALSPSKDVPSLADVEKWMKHYSLETND